MRTRTGTCTYLNAHAAQVPMICSTAYINCTVTYIHKYLSYISIDTWVSHKHALTTILTLIYCMMHLILRKSVSEYQCEYMEHNSKLDNFIHLFVCTCNVYVLAYIHTYIHTYTYILEQYYAVLWIIFAKQYRKFGANMLMLYTK